MSHVMAHGSYQGLQLNVKAHNSLHGPQLFSGPARPQLMSKCTIHASGDPETYPLPGWWHVAIIDAGEDVLQFQCHDNKTLDTLLQICQRHADLI